MNPYASMKTRKQAFVVSKFTGGAIKFSHVRAVEIIDLRISYQKGEPIAYIRAHNDSRPPLAMGSC